MILRYTFFVMRSCSRVYNVKSSINNIHEVDGKDYESDIKLC